MYNYCIIIYSSVSIACTETKQPKAIQVAGAVSEDGNFMRSNVFENKYEPIERIKIGVSSCLLGNPVRFDGGHKKQKYLTDILSKHFDFQTTCPEVSINLGTPRPSIRLVEMERDNEKVVHLVNGKDYSLNYTEDMRIFSKDYCKKYIDGLCGYILKNNSPSCGMKRVKIYNETTGHPRANPGSGIFAEELMRQHPNLPVEEEGRLNDEALRDNFLMRVYIYHEWKKVLKGGITASKLIQFHSRQKYLLMTHNQHKAQILGQLVARAGLEEINQLAENYFSQLMQILRVPSTRQRHTNTLMHLLGYLRESLDEIDREEVLNKIMSYHYGKVPLIAPITLLKHHFNRYPDPYIDIQTYLAPYPVELNPQSQLLV